MDFINFNIIKWFALCPSTAEQKGWTLLAEKQPLCLGVLNESPVDLIPPMMRRRMSSLSKLAVQTAMRLSALTEINYIIFASRHGELSRTIKLIEDIIDGNDASPIIFSQSVHNTAAGLFTIATQQAIPVCSLAAGENTLHSALIEASCYLQDNPEDKVLLLNFDEPLPEHYCCFDALEYHSFALGFLLEFGMEFQIKSIINAQLSESSPPQAFSCIDYLLSGHNAFTIYSKKSSWLWKKTGE